MTDPLKIGMVTACYKPVINGVTRMVSLYKTYLEAQGHQVTVFTMGSPDPAGDEAGVVRTPGLALRDTGYHINMRYTPEAQMLLGQMDIIHCHHLFMSVEMAHRYGRCPIVYTNHTRYDLYSGAVITLPQPAADAIMRQIWPEFTDYADVVITPSESVRNVMLDFGVTRPIEVIPNGIELEAYRHPAAPHTKASLGLPADAPVFIYVGRLSQEKSMETLLEQFAIVLEAVPAAQLLLVGDGPQAAELRELAYLLDITANVRFLGALPVADVPNYLAVADSFVTASESEVHPLTIIEAQAAGLPVVGVVSPGVADTVVHGRSGILTIEPNGGLAAAMVALAVDPDRRQRLSVAARDDSHQFDINHTIARTVELYRRLQITRPDLQRHQRHGRSLRNRERWQPMLDQLAQLLRPATGPLRRRSPEPNNEKDGVR